MKYTVRIADTSYEVEIEDIHTRPIVAHVDGERFEVHPEYGDKPKASQEAESVPPHETPAPMVSQAANAGERTAPLPGTVVEVFVKAGDTLEVGNVVLVIEAMKMKNSIRSTRMGTVAEVLVNAGQTVRHKQMLVRFE